MKKDKIVFVYDAPHYFHADLANSVNAEFYHYANGYKGGLILCQLCSMLQTIPDADVYLVESARCMLPVIKKKLMGSKAKVICINSDTLFYDYSKYGVVTKELISFYLGFIDCFISTSKYVKSLAEKYTKIPHIIVYPYVDYERYSTCEIDLKDKDISSIGNVCKFRGIDLLMQAYEKLKKKNDKLSITIIGREAEILKEVDGYIKRESFWDFLYFNNYYDDNYCLYPPYVYATGRIDTPEYHLTGTYINVARHDSFGINVLEAMSAGIPPIVSTNVGAKEFLPEELICKLNVNDIVKKYNWLNSNIKRKIKLGKLCKKMAKTFTKQASLDDFKLGLLENGVRL